jgi:peptidoglycan/xylan/chitin deacetylase (PgdA/CDA1 family)
VRAAFCLHGEMVEANPHLVRRMREAGHLLVNHGYRHDMLLPVRSARGVGAEIDGCDAAIGRALGVAGYRSRCFRPPGGILTRRIEAEVAARDMRVLPVSCYLADNLVAARGAARLRARVLAHLRRDGGGILVLHDSLALPAWLRPGWADRAWVPAVVDGLIGALRAGGFAIGIDGL